MRLDVVLKVGGEKGKKIDDKSLFLFPILHSPNSTQHTQLSSVSNFYEEQCCRPWQHIRSPSEGEILNEVLISRNHETSFGTATTKRPSYALATSIAPQQQLLTIAFGHRRCKMKMIRMEVRSGHARTFRSAT
jgi:hypothetical protein